MADSITRSLLKTEAEARGWQWSEFIGDGYYFKLTLPDGRWEVFRGSRPNRSSANGFVITQNKARFMEFLQSLGHQVPPYIVTSELDQAIRCMKQNGTVVVKPLHGQRSEGVTVGVATDTAMEKALEYSQSMSRNGSSVIQSHLQGNLYRLVVIDGKFAAAAHRRAATVVGDGTHTVRELVTILNTDPQRGTDTTSRLKQVDIAAVRAYLGVDGLERIPGVSEAVRVLEMESVSAGGEAFNVTNMVHNDWKQFATSTAEMLGLFICGFDVMCEDISQPLGSGAIPILEANSSPGFKIHEYPSGGDPVHLAPLLYDALFPDS